MKFKLQFAGFLFLLLLHTVLKADYATPGTGVVWTPDSLVAYSGGAVTGGDTLFYINATVTITAGDRLDIAAGSKIYFQDQNGSIALIVKGDFFAAGSASAPILFSSVNQQIGDYAGIEFRDAQLEAVMQMNYCIVEYGTRSIKGIYASPVLQNCIVRHSSEVAIDLLGSNARISSCEISNNRQYALKMTGGSSPLVENNLFTENNYQNTSPYVIITVGLQGVNSPQIRGNTIMGGYEKSGGIAIWAQSQAVVENNHVENCAYGILCYQSGANPVIRKNTLLNNNINPDTVNFGFGIACNGPNQPVITGNS
ncbi:MAG: right-handed parallel beta-helix repeat-containing protein, partial [Calditrichia bacterium]